MAEIGKRVESGDVPTWEGVKEYMMLMEERLVKGLNNHVFALEDSLQGYLEGLTLRIERLEEVMEEEERRKSISPSDVEKEGKIGESGRFPSGVEFNLESARVSPSLELRLESLLERLDKVVVRLTEKGEEKEEVKEVKVEVEPEEGGVEGEVPLHTYSWGGNYDVNAYRRSASDINIKGQFI